MVVDRDAEEADLPVPFQLLDRLEPVALADPLVRPDVELLDVDRVQAEVAQALLGGLDHSAAGNASSAWIPADAGQRPFAGGTLVAT